MSTINTGILDGTRRVEPGVRGLAVNSGLAGAQLGVLDDPQVVARNCER